MEEQQEDKNIFDYNRSSINYASRYVTDIPTCRRINPPGPSPPTRPSLWRI